MDLPSVSENGSVPKTKIDVSELGSDVGDAVEIVREYFEKTDPDYLERFLQNFKLQPEDEKDEPPPWKHWSFMVHRVRAQHQPKPSKAKRFLKRLRNCKLQKLVKENVVLNLHTRPLLLFLCLVVYALCGAAVFTHIEQPFELAAFETQAQQRRERHENFTRQIKQLLLSNCTLHTELDCDLQIVQLLASYDEHAGLSAANEIYFYKWNFYNAIFYCGTVLTTIGYGNIYCQSFAGRLLTIFYAILGIPLTLLVLKDIGRLLLFFTQKPWVKLMEYRQRNSVQDSDALKSWNYSSVNEVPPTLASLFVFVYLLMCSVLMTHCVEKEWDFFTAVYFVFVSISTIGFGDVVPEHPKAMLLSAFLFLLGLSLVSLLWNAIQKKFEVKYMAAIRLMDLAGRAMVAKSIKMKRKYSTGSVDRPDKVVDRVDFEPGTVSCS